LADWKLLLHAYGFLGMLETITSMISAFHFGFAKNGVPFSAIWLAYGRTPNIDPAVLAEATAKAQSIYL
jgi:sodium/potassium-transporting ATPase subunit alpha